MQDLKFDSTCSLSVIILSARMFHQVTLLIMVSNILFIGRRIALKRLVGKKNVKYFVRYLDFRSLVLCRMRIGSYSYTIHGKVLSCQVDEFDCVSHFPQVCIEDYVLCIFGLTISFVSFVRNYLGLPSGCKTLYL